MNTIVVYQSSTGFTKQYALWLAEELSCRAVSLKEASDTEIEDAKLVIFGGWVMGGMISGLDKIRKMNPRKLIVFAVGSTPEEMVDIDLMKEQNHLEETLFFYMTGGFHFEKLNVMVRVMLKMLKKSAAKKENKTAQEQFMADMLGTSFDYSDKKYINSLITSISSL